MMNLFGSTEDLKKKKFLFCGLTVAGTKEKKKGGKNVQETGIGYCPFSFCARSRYDKLYRDTGVQGRVVGGHDTANRLATRPCNMARRPCDTALRYG